MSPSLCVLIVEDSEDDMMLLKHTLRRGGYQVTCEVVNTPAAMRAALETHIWDVITSDHAMPHFSAPDALALANELCPNVPFLIVSGEIDLNLAVSLMKNGAKDYIQKRDLARLVPAVERELREADLRRERQRVDAALIESEAKYRRIVETATEGILYLNRDARITFVNQQMASRLGYRIEEMLGRKLDAFLCEDQLSDHYAQMELRAQGKDAAYERCFMRKDGGQHWALVSAKALQDAEGRFEGSFGLFTDITERKRMETARESRLVALTQPMDQPESIDFKDLFDLDTIQNLQDEFASATNVASIITYPDGLPITRPSNFCRLCEHIIRKTNLGQINCFKSDAVIGRYTPAGPIIQPCMSGGLWDAGAGISVGGRHIANWLIGQVRDETQTEEHMRAYARTIGADESVVVEAFSEVPSMSKDQFERVARALFTIANQLSSMAYLNVQQARFITENKRTEEALRLSEANFREVFNSTNEAIFIDDAESGRMLDVNDSMLKLYGYERKEDVLAGSIGDLSANEPPFTEDQAQELVRKAAQEGPQVFEWLAKRRDGSTFWSEVSLSKSQIGGKGRVLAVVRDITARKRSDAERDALLEIMQGLAVTKDLHDLLALVHHAVAKVIYAENFFVVFYNKETGLFEEVYSVDQYDPPAPPSRLEKSITAHTFHSGKPIIMTQALFDELEAQGLVEMVGTNSASWMGAPLNTPDGPIGVIAVQDYATPDRYTEADKDFLANIGSQVALAIERNRTEATLQESEWKFKALFEKGPIGVAYHKMIYDAVGKPFDYCFVDANKSYRELTGVDPRGKTVRQAFPGIENNPFDWISYFGHVARTGEQARIEQYLQFNNSWYDCVSYQYKPDHFVAAFLNITARKQAESEVHRLNTELEQRVAERTIQLEAANKEMEAFSYSVSHDLRAPLRRLTGFSTILLQDYSGQLDEQGQHYLNRIQESSHRMEQLINDLLTLSRVNRADLARQQVDLSALARRIAAELQAQSPHRQVELDIADGMIVQGDENLLKIVLENLLDNAYKFTSQREQAAIQVGVLEQESRPVYYVRDNGAGFDMDYASRLFAPFQRLHSDKDFPGVGIGLATVQRVILRHGGRVWAESEVDKGATFYFTLNLDATI